MIFIISEKEHIIWDPYTPILLPKKPEKIEAIKGNIIIVKYIFILYIYMLAFKSKCGIFKTKHAEASSTTTRFFYVIFREIISNAYNTQGINTIKAITKGNNTVQQYNIN